jgi:hypothetical protein
VRAQTGVRALELTPEALAAFGERRAGGAVRLLRNIGALLGRWLRDAERNLKDAPESSRAAESALEGIVPG